MNETLKIFSGRSNPILAKGIVDHLGLRLGDVTIRTFSDGELWVKFEENIRGADVFIIQSTSGPSEKVRIVTLPRPNQRCSTIPFERVGLLLPLNIFNVSFIKFSLNQ